MNNGVPDDPWAKLNSQIAKTDESWNRLNTKMDTLIEKADELHKTTSNFRFSYENEDRDANRSWFDSLSLIAVAIICTTFIAIVFMVGFTLTAKYSLDAAIHSMVNEDLNKN